MKLKEEARPSSALRVPWLPFMALLLAATAVDADGGEPLAARSVVGAPAMAAARIMSGQQGGPLPLSVMALSDPLRSGESVVPILVRVDGPALLATAGQRRRMPLGIFVYALAPGGRIAANFSEVVEIDLSEHRPCLERGGLSFVGALQLEPGEYSLRVLVRGARGADSGLRVVDLGLPPAGEHRPAILPPLFRSHAPGCLALQQAVAEKEIRVPLVDLGTPPTARPSLEAGTPVEFELLVDVAEGEASAVLELFDASQRLVATLPITVLERRPAEGDRWQRLSAIAAPGDLEPGRYRMRARWGAPTAAPLLSSWLDVDVVGVALPSATPETPTVSAGRRAVAEAAAAIAAITAEDYRRAMQVLSQNDWSAAQAVVAALERRAAGDAITKMLSEIAAAEDAEIERIAGIQAAALIPVYVLHRNLHNRYRADGQFLFAQHARSRAQKAVDLYAEKTDWLTGRETVADLLANLAGDLQRIGVLQLSEDLFRRALASQPGHQAALIGLAARLEKNGAYAEAVELLQNLVDTWPDDSQAALRLAVSLRRLERSREAGEILEKLVAGESPRWVHSLACQELAGLRLRRDAAAAEALLRRCLERSPQDQKLLLQLAFVVSSAGRPQEARQLLAPQSFRAASAPAASPRYRYSLWPAEALAATRDRVRSRALAELPALAAALGAETGGTAP